jgi:hypothetical protein
MFWLFVKKVEGGKRLHFNIFDGNFHDLTRETVRSPTDLGDSRFQILGFRLLENGLKMLVRHTNMHLFRFFVDSLGWLMM